MSLAKIWSAAVYMGCGYILEVEVHIGFGIQSFLIPGLSKTRTQEILEKVTKALNQVGVEFPQLPVTIRTSIPTGMPEHLAHSMSLLELPMAMGILGVLGILPTTLDSRVLPYTIVVGGLGKEGTVQVVDDIPLVIEAAKLEGYTSVIIPSENKGDLSKKGFEVFPVTDLHGVLEQTNKSRGG